MSAEFRTFLIAACLFAIGAVLDFWQARLVKPEALMRVARRTSLVAYYLAIGLMLLVCVTWALRAMHILPTPPTPQP